MGKTHRIDTWECSVMPKLNVALYRDRAKLARDLSERSLEVPQLCDSPAQTFSCQTEFGFCAFVLLESDLNPTSHKVLGLLAHEAVHVACRFFEAIGEEDPAEEEFAYAVGSVASALIHDQLKWGERHAA